MDFFRVFLVFFESLGPKFDACFGPRLGVFDLEVRDVDHELALGVVASVLLVLLVVNQHFLVVFDELFDVDAVGVNFICGLEGSVQLLADELVS